MNDQDYQDATEHQRELDEQAEYEEAMKGMDEWKAGLAITKWLKERRKKWTDQDLIQHQK